MPFARVARVAREGRAGSWARPWSACDRLADRRAAAAARRELAGRLLGAALPCRNDGHVGQDHHGCCLLELGLGHHEPLRRGVPDPAQLARRARARRQGRLCRLAWTPTTPCCSRTCGVRKLRSWPACSARATWRTASSRSFSRCADRRRRLRAAGLSGAGRRAGLLLRCCLA
jgi:hypothetical protein